MKESFIRKAQENYLHGYSCSEAILVTAKEEGLISPEANIKELMQIASVFSGGMGSGCLCGAVAGAQIATGLLFGRKELNEDSNNIRSLSAKFIKRFKEKRKATCCKILTMKYKDDPKARRQNCSTIVMDCAELLYNLAEEELKVSK